MTSEVQSLSPTSRPDRKYFWVRFKHPILGRSIRISLGNNPDEAKAVCDDLSTVLSLRHTWHNEQHQDLDGLHEKSLQSFFEPMRELILTLRLQILQTKIEASRLKLDALTIQHDYQWMTNPEYHWLTLKGEINLCDGMVNHHPELAAEDRKRAAMRAKAHAERPPVDTKNQNVIRRHSARPNYRDSFRRPRC